MLNERNNNEKNLQQLPGDAAAAALELLQPCGRQWEAVLPFPLEWRLQMDAATAVDQCQLEESSPRESAASAAQT